MIKVKEINGSTIKLEVRSFSYQGNFMGESYISFDVNSPVYINFEIGDYIEYRGERFVLNYIPSPIKNGTPGKSGDAFVYMDVKFNSLADELTRCDFLDVVLSDNHVHFTSLSKFSFYAATVKDLADRIQANLNRLYNGGEAWTVTVEEDVAVKDKSLSVDNINCWEALSLVNSDFDANFVISGRTIRIGTAGISVGTVFGYGKGNGLINIEQSTNNDSLIVTRLRAYGSTRNIPYRYYNNLKDSNGTPLIPESMYVNTLMLPGFAENGGDAYVDSPNITRIGIREKSVYFDGSGGLPEIYPSIEGMTAEELKAAGINVNATGRIDEIVSAEQMTDDGIVPEDKEELDKKTFTITLKDIGFNPVDKKHLTTETPFISMKTGMCGGREFEITGCEEKGNNYILTCNREMDSSINKAFPNNPYQVSAGDQFVFIGIAMDDIYIKAAEQRLLTAAKDYLSNNDKSKYTYLPKIDKVFMARHPEIASSLKEGNILDFKDTDLGIDVSVIIQSLVIKEGGPVPEYEITLFNDKVVSTIEKIQNSITSLASNTGITIEQAKSLFATWVEAWRVKWFDQKLRTYDPVQFNSVTSPLFIFNELTTPEFVSGLLGAGTRLKDNHLELDEITVRKRMNVFELLIQRVRAVGGQLLLSPASIKISTVEELENGYKCSFNTDDQTIPEPFVLNDQAFHQTFTGKGINRYWRLTTEAGDDYFVLSKTDCEPGSGIPQPGDEVILLGNRTDKARQSAMMLSAYGNDAPYLDTYDGINDYNLSGKLLTREGNLTGIVDEVFGQLSGSGFYGKNVYLRGKFALSSGVSVEDKFGQTDSQMNNLQGQLTNQQGQLNTQQGQITNIQTDILAIPGQIKQEVSQTVTYEVGNLQIGGINLADYSGGNFLDVLGLYDSSYASKTKIEGKTCLQFNRNSANCRFAHVMVEDGEYTFSLWVKGSEEYDAQVNHYNGSNYGATTVHVTTSWERKVITFTAKAGSDIIHFGTKNTIYITDWKYEKGNKATDWSPSIADQNRLSREIAKAEAELAEVKANAYADGIVTEAEQNAINEAQARLDALKIGSVNLVSRKMMLDWNNKASGIAVWGQDGDGIYLNVSPGRLFDVISTSSYNPIFTLTFKPNTQYVFSVEWKHANQSTTGNGLALYIIYTDGTRDSLILSSDMKIKTRVDLISAKGKTISRISSGYGNWDFNALIYSLALYEGNKVLTELPVATEDLQGQSNVNLLDNSKFQFGTEGYRSNQQATLSIVDGILQVRSSQTTSTPGVRLPIVHLKPGVYTIKTSTRGINIPSHTITVSTANVSSLIWMSGNIPSLSTFTEKVLTFAISTEGDYRVLIMWDASIATTYPAGLDIEYSMLTAGEIASQGWSPSPGDVAKDIKDVSDAVSNLDTTINTTFKDGIISEAEAKAIASNINVLNAEKADIDAYYNKLYANAYLTGTAKTNLASAKTAYNTAHTNLINSINTAIADGKTTATEKADVDDKFTAYNNALFAYQTRVGEADKAIQDTIKKVADDAQTSANTAQSAANAAQSAANQAQADANAANSKLTTWASDNYISPQEKTALRQQKSDIQSEQKDIEANANRYVISLASYMAAYNAAIDALNKYTATSPENIAVSSDYNNISAYYTARQTILNSIAAAAKAQADKATGAIGMDGGKMLYKDPEFKKGYNEIATYGAHNNGDNGKGTVVLSRISKSTGNTSSNSFTAAEATHVKEEAAGSPHNGSDWCLYIKAYGGSNINHLGGLAFGNLSRANAVFIVKVSAKIPVGYTLKNNHNAHGTGYKQELLTSMAGTGKYETYIFKETCGSTGTFSTMNYLYLSGPVKPGSDPLEWFVDYATVFDMTADGYGDIVEIAKTETVVGINNNPDSVTVYAKKTDFNSLNQVVNQQGSQLQVNTNSIDAIVTKNGSGTIVSIKPEMVEITGATVIKDGNGNKVNIFGIGDKVISVNGGVFSVDKAGKVIMQNAEIAGKITAKTGQIGDFTIDGIWLKGSQLRISGSQITFENGNNQVYLNSHPDMTTGGAVKLGTFVLTGGSYNGLESARAVALIAAAPSDNYSCAIAVTSGRVLMKGQIHFDNVVTYTGSGAVTITADSGHFIYLTPITGNPVVSVSSGLPIGSWFIIAHATTAGGFYYIKLSGSDRFRRRGNAYQQVNSNNQDPSLIFKVNNTTWVIGNLPVNWIDWN